MTTPAAAPDHTTAAPKPKRRAVLLATLAVLLLLPLALLAGLLLAAHSERGSRALWQLATLAAPGRLSGSYAGGTLAHGMRLHDLDYRNGALQFRLDRFDGRWQLSRAPLSLTVEYLRLGRMSLQVPPPAQPTPTILPQDLQAPLAFRLKALTLQQLDFQRGATQVELTALALHASSNGLQHQLVLESVQTAYGKASARFQLNGRAPFALGGGAELAGSYRDEGFRLDAHWTGTLSELALELSASGDRLNGQAQLALAPFSPQPLLRAQISAAHINPQLFNAAAPHADLTLHADLVPQPAPADATPSDAAPAADAANAADAAGMLTVSGPVTLTNAIPGPLDQQRLPLVAASLRARLNAQSQQLTDIRIRLLHDAVLSGEGRLQRTDAGSSGEFKLAAERLDLHALHAKLKPTRLRGPLQIGLQPALQQLSMDLADAQYRLQLAAQMDAGQIRVRNAQLNAGAAQLQLSGTLARDAQRAYALSGKLRDFDPALWIDTGAGSTPAKEAPRNNKIPNKALSNAAISAKAKAPRAAIRTGASHAPSARINMDFDASGAFAPERQLRFKFGIHDSSYDKLPLTGGGTLNLAGQRLLPSALQLQIAGNQLSLQGSFGRAGDRLQVKLDAPQLQRLGYGLEGLLQFDGDIAGSLRQPSLHATYRAERLTFGAHHLDGLSGRAEVAATRGVQPAAGSAPPSGPAAQFANALRLAIEVDAHGYRGPDIALQKVHAQLDGSARQHRFSAEAAGSLRGQPLALKLAAHGALSQDSNGRRWDGSIDTLQNQGRPRFALNAPLALSAGADRLQLGATRLTLADAVLDLTSFAWQQGKIRSEGKVSALAVANVLQLQHQFSGREVPFITDLVLDGSWNFELGQSASGFARITRRGGDITFESERGTSTLGLSALQLQADLRADGLQLDLHAAASRIGSAALQAHASWSRQQNLLRLGPDAALAGHATVQLPQLKTVATLAGPQLALDGSLAMELDLAGTLAQPKWSGAISGDRLALTLFDLGIRLHDGVVRIGLQQNLITLQQIEFHGGEGTLRASGQLQLGQSGELNPALSATLVVDHLQLFASPDRRLTLSGQAKISNPEQQLRVDGKVTVDTALFDLPKKSAPQLGDDVVVLRRTKDGAGKPQPAAPPPPGSNARKPAGSWSPVVNLDVNLGRDFRFRGNGADLLLRGSMAVHSEPYAPLRATGTVRVSDGTYEVFGRKLAIERGLLNFQGPINNPNINILAMRRNQEVEAGVEVTGLAQRPRVRLVSEPNVAEEEKLSWLMFGHGSESGGLGQQQAAGAALALLGNASGKRLAQGIGLDEFSIGASESGLADQQVVNLGKAISERFYVGYEQSLTGAASILKITYQLSQRWSLVARAGAISGLDVLFSKRFDGARDKRKIVDTNRNAAPDAAADAARGALADEP
jgi:translocation and assembly module TamB